MDKLQEEKYRNDLKNLENSLRKELSETSKILENNKSFDSQQSVEIFVQLLSKQKQINETAYNQYDKLSEKFIEECTDDVRQKKTEKYVLTMLVDEVNEQFSFYKSIQEKLDRAITELNKFLEEEREINKN